MFFRLAVDGAESSVVLEVENREVCELYLDEPGDVGNKLYEILSVIFDGYSSVECMEDCLKKGDSIIHFNLFQ